MICIDCGTENEYKKNNIKVHKCKNCKGTNLWRSDIYQMMQGMGKIHRPQV